VALYSVSIFFSSPFLSEGRAHLLFGLRADVGLLQVLCHGQQALGPLCLLALGQVRNLVDNFIRKSGVVHQLLHGLGKVALILIVETYVLSHTAGGGG
jgi:hypothetical protein